VLERAMPLNADYSVFGAGKLPGKLFRLEHRSDGEYGPAGQLLESTDAKGRVYRYEYDAEGNLIRNTCNDDELWQYRCGAGGILKRGKAGRSEVTFAYDALGRRVSNTYRGQTTRCVWDGSVLKGLSCRGALP